MFADFSSGSNMDPIAVGRLLLVVVVVWYINVFVTACSQWRDISTKNNFFFSVFFFDYFCQNCFQKPFDCTYFLKNIYILDIHRHPTKQHTYPELNVFGNLVLIIQSRVIAIIQLFPEVDQIYSLLAADDANRLSFSFLSTHPVLSLMFKFDPPPTSHVMHIIAVHGYDDGLRYKRVRKICSGRR